MPELPEVETVVRSVAPHIVGRTIEYAEFTSHRVTRGGFETTANAVAGAYIKAVRRRGKQILIELDRGFLYVHLGMTGKLLMNAARTPYTRAVLTLDEGVLIYDDVRQFGRFEYFKALPETIERVGPDALTVDFEAFYQKLKKHRTRIKALLLNQAFVSGVGNIYADELLFAAGIRPTTLASKISRKRAQQMHASLLQILRLAIEHRGSSISDYVDSDGRRGEFQQLHQVYQRTGEPCGACGEPIKRIVVAQRSTHYCPRCQRA